VDPFIQAPSFSQSINPYSYIMNNPLAGVDPSGYSGKTPSLKPKRRVDEIDDPTYERNPYAFGDSGGNGGESDSSKKTAVAVVDGAVQSGDGDNNSDENRDFRDVSPLAWEKPSPKTLEFEKESNRRRKSGESNSSGKFQNTLTLVGGGLQVGTGGIAIWTGIGTIPGIGLVTLGSSNIFEGVTGLRHPDGVGFNPTAAVIDAIPGVDSSDATQLNAVLNLSADLVSLNILRVPASTSAVIAATNDGVKITTRILPNGRGIVVVPLKYEPASTLRVVTDVAAEANTAASGINPTEE
jgi:hypothetical protein